MSSINPHYTFQYSQPEEYRFSHDSVMLARKVFERVSASSMENWRGLDLCSGCGIVGLDFLFHARKEKGAAPAIFDFVEVQGIYQPHFEENLKRLGSVPTATRFLNINYSQLLQDPSYFNSYDLIVSNPPYFRLGQGKLSPSDFKNRCRFFMDSDFATLLQAIKKALSPQGQAYILLRDLDDHGWDAFSESQSLLAPTFKIEEVDDIRGTALVCISAI